MKTKHTPGPWVIRDATPDDNGRRVETEYSVPFGGVPVVRKHICTASAFWDGTSVARANARLIAAAPELAEALRGVSDYFAEIDAMNPERNHGTEGERIRAMVRAALAKAENITT